MSALPGAQSQRYLLKNAPRLLKDAPRDELLRAVRAAAAGQSVLAPAVATRLMSRVREPSAKEP
jgi:DNA-binding NarL/FixJ family response regulator